MSMQQPPSSKRKLDLAEFPDHIIYLILLKLPTKSLVRFSCLSKSWRETIMSSSFAKQHMQQSLKEATIFSVLWRRYNIKQHEYDFFSYQISSIEYDRQIIRPVRMSRFRFDHNHHGWLARFQSCDGLICIALRGYHVSTSFIYIWNPAIGQHKKIRWPQLLDDDKSRFYGLSFMGFGYDASIDDYKIIVSEGLGAGKWSALVMSLKENTWRRPAAVDLKTPPSVLMIGGYGPDNESNVITLNGDVYWIVIQSDQFDGRSFGLLKFNLTEESFSLLPLPKGIYKHHKLGSHNDGSLFLFLSCYKPNGKTSKVDIWTLQGHKTWCKVRRIPTEEEYGPARSRLRLRPIGFNNMSGDVIMINEIDGSLFVCTPKENKFVKLDIASNVGVARQELFGFDQFMHMDTLVSP